MRFLVDHRPMRPVRRLDALWTFSVDDVPEAIKRKFRNGETVIVELLRGDQRTIFNASVSTYISRTGAPDELRLVRVGKAVTYDLNA